MPANWQNARIRPRFRGHARNGKAFDRTFFGDGPTGSPGHAEPATLEAEGETQP